MTVTEPAIAAAGTSPAWENLRDDFPVLRRDVDGAPVSYLDSAATSLTPQPVIDATVRYYTDVSANIHRGKHMLSDEASDTFEQARQRVAELIGAQADQVAFTLNTTEALNRVAGGLKLPAGEPARVLVSHDAHHSLQLPWRERADVDWIATGPDGQVDLEAYAAQLDRLRPAVVALTHCSNVTGRYTPAAAMAALAREHEALTVLDAAQSVPHRSVRMDELGVDAMAFSAHKMLGPTGIGVLVLGPTLMRSLRPAVIGGGTVDWVDLDTVVRRRPPHLFEAGTPHIAGAYGLLAAVRYLENLGLDALAAHDTAMAERLYAEAGERDYLTVVSPGPGDRGGIVSATVRGCTDLSELARSLSDSYGIMCRSGHLCAQPLVDATAGGQVLRISAYAYTTAAEITAAFAALDQLVPLFTG